ncbi:hypothetical protein CANTEDRAFT_116623 [Yamadazyma tenuis ATCC 10573]|uniref:Assembly factor for the translocase of the inner membrane complexes n=1 Tax=Candida tenuis (strain ATCC 10573 / BCRC 21748 / CBS 615 / JCM 9827 / NBRC 10315 / NRRL Y-1498 / VKM Y-70) TaxID=590646 RepID=G3BEH7_CANTC|nr:assembly factor for the translocase of the inner membrane complexes [Yamadazyma tenuis ATCC 10573]XP_006690402.1 uncharacterized protein CANTEDRAFT_116623 [Yamadazyma tenuis ATCC 10573]EGV61187.1 assembly factor for the translocase of the inner membrane complexes [Yamadazyma tenuis ATCC 10573]EGV61188.1 hypothetical protein CANTEDRAFT_116623 [Yamadazyma tenuis ATCC 10573]
MPSLESTNGNSIVLLGELMDSHTRCVHYHDPQDIIAIKFRCCETYYPCYQCHESAGHPIEKYDMGSSELVVLCGGCQTELTFAEYSPLVCPTCGGQFNPGCKLHYDIYFTNESRTES